MSTHLSEGRYSAFHRAVFLMVGRVGNQSNVSFAVDRKISEGMPF